MNTKLIVALAGSALLALTACEEKTPPATKPATKSAADVAKDATKGVTDTAKKTGEAVKDAGKTAADKVTDTTKKAGEAMKDGADKAKDMLKDGADKAKDMAGDMMAKAKDWGNSYADQLSTLDSKLEGIKTKDDATKALPDIKTITDKINGYVENLNKIAPDAKTKLMAEWKDKLEPLTTKFRAQADRLMADEGIKSVLGDTLKNFKLFQ